MMDEFGNDAYQEAVRSAVRLALDEDRADEDVTTRSVVPPGRRASGRVFFRKEGVLAGTRPFDETFRALGGGVEVRWSKREGEEVAAGEAVCVLKGPADTLLRGERAALNFLMRLSGVATLTAAFVRAVEGTGVEILDTRKTTPGLRLLEKGAVRAGGGVNHRMDRSALALIKENHIAVAGGITSAVNGVRKRFPGTPIEVEVENETELEEALGLAVERVMLDNFDLPAIESAMNRVRREERPPYVELSGGVTLEKAAKAGRLGVSGISVGALTHSAPAADVSFLFRMEP
ncbi:MAG: carboxylating nicotinate-nucleotide diphosphorylase [Candidatus Eisenbacteria bacterium]